MFPRFPPWRWVVWALGWVGAGVGEVPAAAGSHPPAAAAGSGSPPAAHRKGGAESAGGGGRGGGLVAGLVEGCGVGVPVAVRVFAGRAEQSGEARRWVRALVCAAGTGLVDEAVLAVGELFGNAVVHTRSGLRGGTVTVAVTGGGVLHVHDLGSGGGWLACAGLMMARSS